MRQPARRLGPHLPARQRPLRQLSGAAPAVPAERRRLNDVLRLLREGEIEIVGRLWGSTNQAMLGTIAGGAQTLRVVYKPTAGEQPLHDFPIGTLTRREVAAFAVSEATGWGIVPPTVLRGGPFGEGMVQEWIEPDETVDVVAMIVADDERLRPLAIFDAIVNNTDRKGGHILPLPSGAISGVDHGVTFSTHPKLRTVLWGWRGSPLRAEEVRVVRAVREALDGALGEVLGELLAVDEVAATVARTDALLASRTFPEPPPDWPAVPWPPY